MESITIYPKDEKQKSLLKSLFEEMQIRFEMGMETKDHLLSEEEFYSKIDRSIAQAEAGNTRKLSEKEQKELLGQ